jgi:hypothetical protein
MSVMTESTYEPPERVLSLSEVAELMDMKRPNVAKYLARKGIRPKFVKAQGYLWDAAQIERLKAEREADAELMAANERRRASALGLAPPPRDEPGPARLPEAARLGPRQKELLLWLESRPAAPVDDKRRLVLRRLRLRGLVEPVPGERKLYQLTELGMRIAGELEDDG